MKKPFRIAHLADVHYRGLSRHGEYRNVSEQMFAKMRKQRLDAIFVAGDIVHSKVENISPELVQELTWWMRSLGNIAPTYVMLGNHDGLLNNPQRQDTISPIITALNHPNVHLFKQSVSVAMSTDVYLHIFSPFDKSGWRNLRDPQHEYPDAINIAGYHGVVHGAAVNGILLDPQDSAEIFAGYDFAFLGDIHERQNLDDEGRVHYPGSLIQQNFGETTEKGYSLWEIRSRNDWQCEFVPLHNKESYITIHYNDRRHSDPVYLADIIREHPVTNRIRIVSDKRLSPDYKKQIISLTRTDGQTYRIHWTEKRNDKISYGTDGRFGALNIRDAQVHKKLMDEFVAASSTKKWSDKEREGAFQILENMLFECEQTNHENRGTKWTINEIAWDNIFAFSENNRISFSELNGLIGIFGPNRSGKSSVAATIMYALFNSTDRGNLYNRSLIRNGERSCSARATFVVDGTEYKIERRTKIVPSKGKENTVSYLELYRKESDGSYTNLTAEKRVDTERVLQDIIGKADDFLQTSFSSQGKANQFIETAGTGRKALVGRYLDLKLFEDLYVKNKERLMGMRALEREAAQRNAEEMMIKFEQDLRMFVENMEEIHMQVAEKEGERKRLTAVLTELRASIRENETLLKMWEMQHNSENRVLVSERENLQRVSERVESFKLQLERLRKKIVPHVDETTIASMTTRLKKLETLVRQAKEQNSKSDKRLHEIQLEIKQINRSLETVAKIPCDHKWPTCPLLLQYVKAQDTRETLEASLTALQKESAEIVSSVSKNHEVISQSEKERTDLAAKKAVAEKNLVENRFSQKEIDRLVGELSTNEPIETALRHTVQELEEKVAAIYLQRASIPTDELTHAQIRETENDLAKIDKWFQQNEDDITRYNVAGKSILEFQIECCRKDLEEHTEAKHKVRVCELLAEYLSANGAPMLLIQKRIPEINAEISSILDGVVNYSVEMVVNEIDNIDISISYKNEIEARQIETASGMEKFIASLALRIALINVSTLPKCDVFIIDEGFDVLDGDNISAATEMLQKMKEYFRTILVISHVGSIKEAMDDILHIDKTDNTSRIYV